MGIVHYRLVDNQTTIEKELLMLPTTKFMYIEANDYLQLIEAMHKLQKCIEKLKFDIDTA